jgi:hypothetical protein
MTDRRYRPAGYRSEASAKSTPRGESPLSPPAGALRNRPVSRCAECGSLLPIAANSLAQCPHCQAALHSCRQCAHFDPGRRFECAQPIPERLPDKRAGNDCMVFALTVRVEREAAAPARPEEGRRAFGNLFKK